MTLLQGVALPKDVENLPPGKANNMAELCVFLAKARQCASRAFGNMDALLETRRSLRRDLQVKRDEANVAAELINALEEKVAEAAVGLEERDRLLIEVKDLKAERDRLKEEKQRWEDNLLRQLEQGGDAGYNEAGEHYKQQVEGLVKKVFKEGRMMGIEETHSSSFLLRYQVGLDYAEVPPVDHQREPLMVPSIQLPSDMLPPQQPDPTANA
ncbi:hypothetical protein RHMOL_Rhmol05G0158600 [Rhododendron molle]|uniref:Uncharacterized protein n=1 Tax=Rhododendron molle TaxID=49168 RepID=A0ACC0NPD9_RHOML|nr:hypothetical protein RHMOL_Rhmol05G0158600 [Rhododendron molle]